MATLVKTVKNKAFKEGKATFKRYFEELERYGVEARAIRKFNNDDSKSSFYTVEITRLNLLRILEDLTELRDNQATTQTEIDSVQVDNYFLDKSTEDLQREVTRLQNIVRSQTETLQQVQQLINKLLHKNRN